MNHLSQKLMGSMAATITVDMESFDKVLGEDDDAVFVFAGPKEVLDFANSFLVVEFDAEKVTDFQEGAKARNRENLKRIKVISLDFFGHGLGNNFKFFDINNGMIDLNEPENERIINLEVNRALHLILFPNIKHVQIPLLDDERCENMPVKRLVYGVNEFGGSVLSSRCENFCLDVGDFALAQLAIREP